MKVKYTPYDYIITNEYLTLNVSSKGKTIPVIDVQLFGGKYVTLSVPMTFFSDTYEECLEENIVVCDLLKETTKLERVGWDWVVSQSWGDESYSITVPHKEMLKILQHCSRKVQSNHLAKKRKFLHKIPEFLLTLYNLPVHTLKKLN